MARDAQRRPACGGGKVKYYRNPMGTPDTSPEPKKDSMKMDYIPVFEDEAGDDRHGQDQPRQGAEAGCATEAASNAPLSRTVRASPPSSSTNAGSRRRRPFGGWIEKLVVKPPATW